MLAKNDPSQERKAPGVVQRAEGMEANESALLPPLIKLVQAQTKDADRYGAGKFVRLDTEEVFDSLEVIPLVSRVIQTKWPSQFSRDAQPECWSSNGIQADPGAAYAARICAQCPFYDPRPHRGKGRAMCETGHNLILQDANTFDPLGLRVRGTGNKIIGLVTAPSIAQQAVILLYSEKVEGDSRGAWYQLKAKTVRKLDEADASLAKATMRGYLETRLGYEGAEEEQPNIEVEPKSPAPVTQRKEVPSASQRQALPADQRPKVGGDRGYGLEVNNDDLPF